MIHIEPLSSNFSEFGIILEFSASSIDPRFEILVEEAHSPWRIAMFRSIIRTAKTLECHPHSLETFEPVRGIGVLIVAPADVPDDCRIFLLDKAVCLRKGIWHEVLSLSDEAIYKITENLNVETNFHTLNSIIEL